MIKNNPILKMACIFFISLFLFGCCTTVKNKLNDPVFQTENQPIRTLSIFAYKNNNISDTEIISIVSETSRYLEKQIGVRLEVKKILFSKTEYTFDYEKLLIDLYNEYVEHLNAYENGNDNYDLIVYFHILDPMQFAKEESIKTMMIPVWEGIFDDYYRRYMALKHKDPWILLHEIFHCFILTHDHSDCGIMFPLQGQIFPFLTNLKFRSYYLGNDDRKEALKNKFRNFNNLEKVGCKSEYP